jgi:hypothetical protein
VVLEGQGIREPGTTGGKGSCPFRLILGVVWAISFGTGSIRAQAGLPEGPLTAVEQAWLEFRTLHDQLRLTRNLGATISPRGVPADSLTRRLSRESLRLQAMLKQIQPARISPEDARAFTLLTRQLAELEAEVFFQPPDDTPEDCREALPEALSWAPLDSLSARTFACYGQAARRIVVDRDTLDRLSILGLLGRTDDPERRRRLFLALEPVWRSVNGDDAQGSPYRAMVRLRRARWAASEAPFVERARGLGVASDTLEGWLVAVLEAWRGIMPDSLVEPWDFYYRTGEASRRLSSRIPLDSLRPLTERYYRSLGADPARLGVRYDLVPRPGKYPISFTDFGARTPIEPWIFTSYRIGGLDNLAELLHEVGHAVHLGAIRTRGAYTDWPDSDTFTEAIADIAALELYEPEWQRRFLGSAAPLSSSLRAKYAGIVLDVAWSLLEIRAHRYPEQSPNQIWTELTRDYLRVRPHPEWSWWAMRGQLVNSPGYMLNYAFGAILIADLRAQLIASHGEFTTGDPGWYRWVAERLFRFGRERAALQVVESFLGRGVSVAPLLADLSRARLPAR